MLQSACTNSDLTIDIDNYFLDLFLFKSGPSISPNKAPESGDPYFFTASFACFSSSVFIDNVIFLFSLSSSAIIASTLSPLENLDGRAFSVSFAN